MIRNSGPRCSRRRRARDEPGRSRLVRATLANTRGWAWGGPSTANGWTNSRRDRCGRPDSPQRPILLALLAAELTFRVTSNVSTRSADEALATAPDLDDHGLGNVLH